MGIIKPNMTDFINFLEETQGYKMMQWQKDCIAKIDEMRLDQIFIEFHKNRENIHRLRNIFSMYIDFLLRRPEVEKTEEVDDGKDII